MRKKKKVKKNFKRLLIFMALLCILLALVCFGAFDYFRVFDMEKLEVENVSYKDKTFKIKTSDFYGDMVCSVTDDVSKAKWVHVKGNICEYKIDKFGNYDIYFKNKSGTKKVTGFDKVYYAFVKKDKYYLALKSKKKISYDYVSIGDVSISKSSDDSIAYLKDDYIYSKGSGTATIEIGSEKITVVSTGLINKMPKKYKYNRSYLSCGVYSTKQAKLLDEILADRVKEAGEGTRAGVVAAARFLTLEFPYRISYFSENGRLTTNGVDAEGRYYHKGLYLSEDKFSDIGYSLKGPATWGCYMRSNPSKGKRRNGLDCSGFTTWVVLNGGFDIGDYGARGKTPEKDLNTFGEEKKVTYKLAMSDKIKAGDLLGEVTESEGHSAIVVGVDDENFYVAESLWIYPLGVNVNTYKRSTFANHFETVNLMDSYYKKDGNYTAMWY